MSTSASQLGFGVMIQQLVGNRETLAVLESVIGKVIVSASIVNNELRLEVSEGEGTRTIRIVDNGQSCCEHRHMSCDDDLSTYVGARLLRFELTDGPTDDIDGDLHETQFLRVHTTKDIITVVNHNEHNGYYGGFAIEALSEA